MNTIRCFKSRVLALFIILLILGCSHCALMAQTPDRAFKWMDDADYRPIIYLDKDNKPAGFWKDLMDEIFRRMDIPLHCELYPWKRTQKYVEEGLGDGMVTTMTTKRSARFKATDPLFVNSERVFARCDNPRIGQIMAVRSVADLKPFTIVETIGSGWSKEHFKELKVIWAPTYTAALNLLANGRVDIYVIGKEAGMMDIVNQIRKHSPYSDGLKKIIVGEHPLAEINFCLLIRKDSPFVNIIPKFNKTLRQLKEDGTYQKIYKSYFAKTITLPTKDTPCH
jgi:polar amino acid transport system substrate-binding protein